MAQVDWIERASETAEQTRRMPYFQSIIIIFYIKIMNSIEGNITIH